MTRQEHLLTIAAEECNEVAQRISKALRFGMSEIEPGQPESNQDRIEIEASHLLSALEMLGLLDQVIGAVPTDCWVRREMDAKRSKVERYLSYSRQCGTITEGTR